MHRRALWFEGPGGPQPEVAAAVLGRAADAVRRARNLGGEAEATAADDTVASALLGGHLTLSISRFHRQLLATVPVPTPLEDVAVHVV